MKHIFCTLFVMLFLAANLIAQVPIQKGVILQIDGDKVMLDLKNGQVKKGDQFKVVKDGGYMIHPTTGAKIKKNDEIISILKIVVINDEYSEAIANPASSAQLLRNGMAVYPLTDKDISSKTEKFKNSVAVMPFQGSGFKSGYMSIYTSDIMTEELFKKDKFNMIDRQTLNMQMDEIARGEFLNDQEALQLGKTKGVKYFVIGTIYEPDIVQTSTGIPLQGIFQAAELLSGKDLGSQNVSNVEIKKLKAVVKIVVKVVNVETGAIEFICSEMAKAEGESSVELEEGLLGGSKIKGGATAFSNSILGQAVQTSLNNLSTYVEGYFDGKITAKSFTGNIIGQANTTLSTSSKKSNKNDITFSGQKINDEDTIFLINKGRKNGIHKRFQKLYVFMPGKSEITGLYSEKYQKIGYFKPNVVDKEQTSGKFINSQTFVPFDTLREYARLRKSMSLKGFITISPYFTKLAERTYFGETNFVTEINAGVQIKQPFALPIYFSAKISIAPFDLVNNNTFEYILPEIELGYSYSTYKGELMVGAMMGLGNISTNVSDEYRYIEDTSIETKFGLNCGYKFRRLYLGLSYKQMKLSYNSHDNSDKNEKFSCMGLNMGIYF